MISVTVPSLLWENAVTNVFSCENIKCGDVGYENSINLDVAAEITPIIYIVENNRDGYLPQFGKSNPMFSRITILVTTRILEFPLPVSVIASPHLSAMATAV